MKIITVTELKAWMDEGKDFQLVDVREGFEADIAAIGGLLIPVSQVAARIGEIAKDKPVVVHCRSGARSANVIAALEAQGYTNLSNLQGGIIAWSNEIDATVPKY
jgi:sulfur-carrier protein adenylyltransferase/sulfurtransferase